MALVITSLLVAILMASLYYVFRVQTTMRDEVLARETELKIHAWFSEALEGCLPAERNTDSSFVGSVAEIRCETTTVLSPRPIPVPLRITFALRRVENGYALTYREQGSAEARQLASWPVREAAFRFMDARGAEMEKWPLDRTDAEVLPRLIRLVLKGMPEGGDKVWMVAPRADGFLAPTVKNPFGFEVSK